MGIKPRVGMPCTIVVGSDRHAATVIEVYWGGNRIIVRPCKATRTDNNGQSESQAYTYAENPDGELIHFSLRRNGMWWEMGYETGCHGRPLHLGERREYRDPSF